MILHKLKNSREEVFLTISLDEEIGCIFDAWTGPFETQENFKFGLKLIVDEIEKNKVTKWLADLREMKGSWDFNRTWMVEELMPRAFRAGLKFEAVVLPKETFSKLSTVETIALLDGFMLRQFDDLDSAKDWLRSV